MKTKTDKTALIGFILLYTSIVIVTIVFLCLKNYGGAIFAFLPSFFLYPIYLTFTKTPKRADLSLGLLILLILLRAVLVALAFIIPLLMWYFLDVIRAQTSLLFLLFPLFEVFFIYNIVVVVYIRKDKKTNKKKDRTA